MIYILVKRKDKIWTYTGQKKNLKFYWIVFKEKLKRNEVIVLNDK